MRRKPILPATARLSPIWKLLCTVALSFQLTFRFLHVHIILRATNWSSEHEDAKVVLFKNRKIASLSALLHLVPVGTALAFTFVNARPTYVGNVSTTTIAALQFCAKLWEILMQASITAIVLSVIRQQVIASRAIPLGVFLAPYRVLDVSFLWSLEFWAVVTSNQFPLWRKVLLSTTIPLAVILAALVGPSGAIVMIPRSIKYALPPSLVVFSQEPLFYPEEVSLKDQKLANEASVMTNFKEAATFNHILRPQSATQRTAAISDDMVSYYLRSATICIPPTCYAATVPQRLTGFLHFYAQPDMDDQSSSYPRDATISHIRQPLVSQSCLVDSISAPEGNILKSNILDLNSTYISFGDDHPELSNVLTYANLLPNSSAPRSEYCQDFRTFSNPTNGMTLGWCGGSRASHNFSLLMVQVPYSEEFESATPWLIACVIRAQWVQTAVNLTASSSTISSVDSLEKLGSSTASLIRVQSSWAERATKLHMQAIQNMSTDDDAGISYPSIEMHEITAIALSDVGPNYTGDDDLVDVFFDPKTLNPVLTRYFEDPSRFGPHQYDVVKTFLRDQSDLRKFGSVAVLVGYNDTLTDSSSLKRFEIQRFLLGYGYDTSDITVKLALAVLTTYVCVVMFHLCYSLISGCAGTSWDAIGELVMLSLNSERPSHLKGTSVGVQTLSTYRQSINVRINRENSAEIVFEDDPDLKKAEYTQVEANKKYY